jgi:MarR family transcriptional regulator for hemolysin
MNQDDNNLGFLLSKTSKLLKNRFNDRLKDYGLTSSQVAVLRDMHRQELTENESKNVSPAAVAQRLHIDRPTMSGIMERLIGKEWIMAITNPEDRRSQIISLTDKSRDMINELSKQGDDVVERAVDGFADREVEQLKVYLNRIINNLL